MESHGSNHPCFCCQANAFGDHFPWSDFRHGAAYLATFWTNAAWLLARPNRMDLFRVQGVGIEQAQPDTMHTKHGGVDSYCYGSVLKFLVEVVMAGTPAANLSALWIALTVEFKKRPPVNQFTGMTKGMFDQGDDKFPQLRQGSTNQKLGTGVVSCLEVVRRSFESRPSFDHESTYGNCEHGFHIGCDC